MKIEEFAEKNGFVKLTKSNHPKDGQTVQILGSSWTQDYKIEKVKWCINNGEHSYIWITHEFNKGIMTTNIDYWKPI